MLAQKITIRAAWDGPARDMGLMTYHGEENKPTHKENDPTDVQILDLLHP